MQENVSIIEYYTNPHRKLRNREKLPPNAYTGEMINDSHQLDDATSAELRTPPPLERG